MTTRTQTQMVWPLGVGGDTWQPVGMVPLWELSHQLWKTRCLDTPNASPQLLKIYDALSEPQTDVSRRDKLQTLFSILKRAATESPYVLPFRDWGPLPFSPFGPGTPAWMVCDASVYAVRPGSPGAVAPYNLGILAQEYPQDVPLCHAVRLIAQAARGVRALQEAAQEAGFPQSHGRLNPLNLIPHSSFVSHLSPLASRDPGLQIRVSDFGLHYALTGERRTPRNDQQMLRYAAPETFDTFADARSDVYSLGIILYELLFGECPFHAGNYDVLQKAREASSGISLPKPLPTPLIELLVHCLQKNPADRFPDGGELARALEDLAKKLPDVTVTDWEKQSEAVRRNPSASSGFFPPSAPLPLPKNVRIPQITAIPHGEGASVVASLAYDDIYDVGTRSAFLALPNPQGIDPVQFRIRWRGDQVCVTQYSQTYSTKTSGSLLTQRGEQYVWQSDQWIAIGNYYLYLQVPVRSSQSERDPKSSQPEPQLLPQPSPEPQPSLASAVPGDVVELRLNGIIPDVFRAVEGPQYLSLSARNLTNAAVNARFEITSLWLEKPERNYGLPEDCLQMSEPAIDLNPNGLAKAQKNDIQLILTNLNQAARAGLYQVKITLVSRELAAQRLGSLEILIIIDLHYASPLLKITSEKFARFGTPALVDVSVENPSNFPVEYSLLPPASPVTLRAIKQKAEEHAMNAVNRYGQSAVTALFNRTLNHSRSPRSLMSLPVHPSAGAILRRLFNPVAPDADALSYDIAPHVPKYNPDRLAANMAEVIPEDFIPLSHGASAFVLQAGEKITFSLRAKIPWLRRLSFVFGNMSSGITVSDALFELRPSEKDTVSASVNVTFLPLVPTLFRNAAIAAIILFVGFSIHGFYKMKKDHDKSMAVAARNHAIAAAAVAKKKADAANIEKMNAAQAEAAHKTLTGSGAAIESGEIKSAKNIANDCQAKLNEADAKDKDINQERHSVEKARQTWLEKADTLIAARTAVAEAKTNAVVATPDAANPGASDTAVGEAKEKEAKASEAFNKATTMLDAADTRLHNAEGARANADVQVTNAFLPADSALEEAKEKVASLESEMDKVPSQQRSHAAEWKTEITNLQKKKADLATAFTTVQKRNAVRSATNTAVDNAWQTKTKEWGQAKKEKDAALE